MNSSIANWVNRIFRKKNKGTVRNIPVPAPKGDVLVSEERFVPEFQPDVPWAAMHMERYRFACKWLLPSDSVLDVACGAGYGSKMMMDNCQMVIGVDKSKATIDYAQENYGGNFIQSDLFGVSSTADVVVSFETIEHVNVPLRDTVMFLAGRAKRLVIGSVPYDEKSNNPFHFHFGITEEDLSFLKNLGELDMYYQEKEPGHRISKEYKNYAQNLVFVLKLKG